MAVAHLGLTPDEFWFINPREFQVSMQAYRDKVEMQARQELENTRFGAWLSWQPHLSEEDQVKVNHPAKIYTFSWEEPPREEKKEITEEHMKKGREWAFGDNTDK